MRIECRRVKRKREGGGVGVREDGWGGGWGGGEGGCNRGRGVSEKVRRRAGRQEGASGGCARRREGVSEGRWGLVGMDRWGWQRQWVQWE